MIPNGGLSGPMEAMLSGAQQGNDMARSVLPSVYQPQGKAYPQNPWQGTIDLICDQLLSLGKQIKDQGEEYREEGDTVYELCTKLAKVNSRLTKLAQEGSDTSE